jgi:2-keto-4-pentenoate hydratase/2-oxohepta-3-ene-1,7-dioic acid hydratase in catechol pathway
MRLFSYRTAAGPALGVLASGDTFVPVPGLSMLRLIDLGEGGLDQARRALESGPPRPLAGVDLLPPIPDLRRNVFCLGWNYADHSREAAAVRGKEARLPERPVFFTKATGTLNGPRGDIPMDPSLSQQYDWEVELALVLGLGGRDIPRERALDHVFGYTVVNDVSARDLQTGHGGQFFKGKSLDGTCPMGPWIVTRDEVPDPHALRLSCHVNGVLKQEGCTADLIFDLPAILEWLSRGLTLLPGDVISTGTPAGVGFARHPPEFLRVGDLVECTVEGLGTLRNRVVLG